MKRIFFSIIICSLFINTYTSAQTIDQKVDSLLNLMSLDEKIGQMTQVERGALENINDISYYDLGSLLSGGGSSPQNNSVTGWANMYDAYQNIALQSRLGIPLIYGVDAVHGHNNVYGSVIFPHNIGLGCTWNPELVESVNKITAKEVAATGIDWTFSPCIAVPQNERWGRTYEGFGETAEIQKIMAAASVMGLQDGDLSSNVSILACAKHFVGDGGTTYGIDQGNTQVSEVVLRELHMAGYIDAIDSDVGSIMASYNSWNGQKLHGHDYLLTDVLKNELGFEGFIISDWAGVDQITEDYRESVKRAINAGIDMVMVPDRYIYFISILKDLVENNEVSIDRIDDAVKRILKQKFLLNLFEEPLTDNSLASSFGSEEHRNVARQAVRESIVLLSAKNDILPLQKNNQKIMVAGSLAKDLGGQCGGWTISWQGSNGNITIGTDILSGIQEMVQSSEVIYSPNGDYQGEIDIAVVVIGENPYAEGAGDKSNLNVALGDVNLIKKLKEEGIQVITVFISGRPMIIGELLPYTDAFIAAWLPGTEGDGIAEVLFGDYQPSGRLTHSWPKTMSQIPINFGDENYNPLFEYKYGLQNFPNSTTNPSLQTYSTLLNNTGTKIILTLTDKVSSLNYELDDFLIKVNGVVDNNNIDNIIISDFDESILEISLINPIESNSVAISLTYTGNGIVSSDLSLTNFYDYFVYNAFKNDGMTNDIPGRIEAENYFQMFGVGTEECTDIGGGLNVGWIESGDWMEYSVTVNTTGNYNLTGRITGYNSGSLLITFNNTNQTYINYESTNGWQNWKDFSTDIFLEEGTYTMKALSSSNAYNINYFDFEIYQSIQELNNPTINDIKVYPMPVNDSFSISFSSMKNNVVSIVLFDLTGKRVQSLYQGDINSGLNTLSFSLNFTIPNGIYFIEIKDDGKRNFIKLIKN